MWRRLNKKNVLLGTAVVVLAVSLGGVAVVATATRSLPDPNTLTTRSVAQSTKIYDRTGETVLYEIHGDENRTLVKLSEGFCKDDSALEVDPNGIPLYAIQASITAEDRAFCKHRGFSVRGILRAALRQATGGSGGGSTLTQQLVKNAILTNERRLSRKIKELVLSIEIERRYSKDEILQIYFNEIPYGSTNYGIDAAARRYFGKPVSTLTLAEAATLAALPQRPTTLLNRPDLLESRRNWILDGMVELGFVDAVVANEAKKEVLALRPVESNILAPHFVFYVKERLEEMYGEHVVETGGLKVVTSLDLEKQVIAEEEVMRGVEDRGDAFGFGNAALVATDPTTGHIVAMVGSKDFFDEEIDGQVNIALRPLQPGSSFKPIVYAAGFEKGYTPNTVLWDVNMTFPSGSGPYEPKNYDLKERGPLTARAALQGSLNIPAVEYLYLVGVDRALDFAERLGYSTFQDQSNFGLAIVLGGAEVKLLDHVGAYATFANRGVRFDPVGILRVEDAQGNILYEWKPQPGVPAIAPEVADTITNVISDNVARSLIFGSQSYLQLGERPVAAKTGTTNDYRAAWTLGYTPSLAAGVWVGNNDNTAMRRGADGSVIAAPIWNAFMRRALTSVPIQSFITPTIPLTGKSVLDGNLSAQTVVIDRASNKRATTFTPESYRITKQFVEYHNPLHYLQKDDPRGPTPSDPSQDPLYAPWEAAILDWLTRQQQTTGVVFEQGRPPTEDDDVHLPVYFPSVGIETPSSNTEIGDRQLVSRVLATAPRGISRVEWYLDGYYLAEDRFAPYEISAAIPDSISRGYHTLEVVAYDDVDNRGSASIGIRLMSDGGGSKFEIQEPKNGQQTEQNGTMNVVVYAVDASGPVQLSSRHLESGTVRTLSPSNPSGPLFVFPWSADLVGSWVLSAQTTDALGNQRNTSSVLIRVLPISQSTQGSSLLFLSPFTPSTP